MKKFIVLFILLTFAPFAMASDLIIATGSEGGGYERTGIKIAQSIKVQAAKRKLGKLQIDVVNTSGSLENIELFDEGEAHIAIMQADALALREPKSDYKVKPLGQEAVYWFANKKNDYYNLSDIEGVDNVLMVLVDGSGGQLTMQNFVKEDDGYKVNFDTAILADDLDDAMDIVATGTYKNKKVAGVLYVTSFGGFSSELAADYGKYIVVGSATDKDFNDTTINGEPLYTNCEIENDGLRGFSSSNTWTDNETVCLNSVVIYTKDLPKKVFKAVRKGITKALR
jgi:TRAP-type uncharacterized transport system substrate-binding protein